MGCALVLATGCIAGQDPGYPLYPVDPPRASHEVARLVGYVRFVDGQDVSSLGKAFELLPGCHVVGTPSSWTQGQVNAGATTVQTGRVDFALPMRAGHQYVIEVYVEPMTGPTGRAGVRALERTASGETTHVFVPASAQMLASCLAASPGVVVTAGER